MSANKAERVIEIDQICGRLYEERRMRLELMPYRVGYPIFLNWFILQQQMLFTMSV
uniref:Ribosomal protein L22 n=3 Tax=Quercus TaxID=3511 RepID=A0A6M3QET3_9ROSI|nr:ribosomal protein L22 [Quercus wutaishanica]YP_009828514.1 ribosomal protein L22 [Quercus fenchengensis]QVV25372.1 ribosomal protein L22 [Quercus mongolica]WDE74197.1 ribosomal protein L22 [Quercus sp. YQL-2023a]QDE53328.1 ribosomal protein L22 [Quercus wutaishanica]QJC14026.1 ribosomal protein L22 [Quercus fenchengensis]ULU21885.1 ribosomal protein L22 [Quercus mongolica]